jgi:hypothetical protein
MTINYFFMSQHRRLRNRFKMATIERHEDRVASALEARYRDVDPKELEALAFGLGMIARRDGRRI